MKKHTKQDEKIIQNLQQLLTQTYAPYSKIQVSAIVVTTNNNQHYHGVNIENASFTPSICAERCAIFKAVSEGNRQHDFNALHLMSSTTIPLYPCGVCLQVMSEFFDPNTPIYIYQKNGKLIAKETLIKLLPHRITKESF